MPRKKTASKSDKPNVKQIEADSGEEKEEDGPLSVNRQEKLHDNTHQSPSSNKQSQLDANASRPDPSGGTIDPVAPEARAAPRALTNSEPLPETSTMPKPVVESECRVAAGNAATKKRGRPLSNKKKAAVMVENKKENTMHEPSDVEDDEAETEDGAKKRKVKRGRVSKSAIDNTMGHKRASGPTKKRETKKQKEVNKKMEAKEDKEHTDSGSVELDDDSEPDTLSLDEDISQKLNVETVISSKVAETPVRRGYRPPGFKADPLEARSARVDDKDTTTSVAGTVKSVNRLDEADVPEPLKQESIKSKWETVIVDDDEESEDNDDEDNEL